jgi:type II secretory pathway pseudopilin PulG
LDGKLLLGQLGVRQPQLADRCFQSALAFLELLELLVVMAIIAILLVAVVPALTTIKTAGGVTNAAYTIKDALEQARTYAMANNTYVWVGFYEEATTAAVPTNTAPPYSGTGRVVIGVVYSRDGTKIFDSSDPTAPLPPSSINSLGKLLKIEGIHLTDIGSPSGGSPDNLDGRPDWPYTYAGRLPVRIASSASFDAGLDVVAPVAVRPMGLPRLLLSLVRGAGGRPGLRVLHDVDRLVVRCDRPMPLQVDGEDLGDVEQVELASEPRAVVALVPG